MALAQCLVTLVVLASFCFAFACLGERILRLFQFRIERDVEYLLVAIGVGVVCTEILLFLIQFAQLIRQGILVVVGLLCLPFFSEFPSILRRIRSVFQLLNSRAGTGSRFLLFAVGIVLCLEFLTSMAPLTGSDAQQYHFTAQQSILANGFHPSFSNTHSFLCGQHHLLILLGLALGSEKLALGFIFLGGVLSAATLASLAARWASDRIVLGITLLFLLTPVVFWQMSSSGAPDIYLAFFVGTVLIVLNQSPKAGTWQQALVAGLLAGGVAGAKYSGCVIAAAVVLALIVEFRSMTRAALLFIGSLIGGIWPYLRNTIWTGNPIFPFLSQKLSPHLITAYGLTSLAVDTGMATKHNPAQLLLFLFFAGMRAKSPGFWDFFGPTVLALASLIFLAFENTRAWRLSVLIWFMAGSGIFFASGLQRFLLPIFPIGLSCVAAGIECSLQKNWRISNAVSIGTMAIMILAGAVGLMLYCKEPIQAAVGLTDREAYLADRAQDYQTSQAINQILGPTQGAGKALVFLQHRYYLHIVYLNGDPDNSFEVDPERMKSPEQWKEFFKAKGITYVVRSPNYPAVISAPLEELEKRGVLKHIEEREVENLSGMRMDQVRGKIAVVILRVNF